MIQDTSEECSLGGTEFFSTAPTQTSVRKRRKIIQHPQQSTIVPGAPIDLIIAASDDGYMNLSHALHVEIKIVKADGSNMEVKAANDDKDDNQVALGDMPLHNLFSQVDVYINEKLVTTSGNNYPYTAYFEKMLTYDPLTLDNQFSLELISVNMDGKLQTFDATDDAWKNRAAYTNGSKSVYLRGSLHIPILRQEKHLLNQCSMRIKLHPNNQKFTLMSKDDATYKLKIVSAHLEMEKLEMNPDVLNEHADKLRKQNAVYPIRRGEIKTFSIPAGNTSVVKENLFVGKLPRRLVIANVDSEGYSGKLSMNPFNFQHFGLNYLCVYVDGERYPNKALEPNFANGDYLDCLSSVYDGTGMRDEDRTLAINRTNYPKGNAIYVIQLTPGEPNCAAYDLVQKGNIRLEMKFTAPLAKTVTTLVYAEYDDQIEIDNDRNVFIDV